MASPTPKRAATQNRYPSTPPADALEVVDPRWLLKALALTLAAAALLGYLCVCLLVYVGGWQLLLHPSAKVDATPAIPYQPIRFDSAVTGSPRLTAWWIPAESPGPTTPTILYLHDGTGSLSDNVRKLELLHRAAVNIFAIDYRGFGQSNPPHATESRMAEDTAAALDYLVDTRHIPATTIVPYGVGLGAVLAANLTNAHPELPAVIIDTPDPNAFANATDNGRSRLLPMRLLVQEHFDIAAALAASTRPKLLLADSPFGFETARVQANQTFFHSVPDPKIAVTFAHINSEDAYLASINRFLGEYLSHF
jgi:pimeloyl-ACP methyl ester carboxylesterase